MNTDSHTVNDIFSSIIGQPLIGISGDDKFVHLFNKNAFREPFYPFSWASSRNDNISNVIIGFGEVSWMDV